MSDLDEKLREAIKTVIEPGYFTSQREFLVQITERFVPDHNKSPMQVRIDKAGERIRQAFIDAGWLSPEVNEAVAKYLEAGGSQDFVVMSRTDWERNAKLAGVMTGLEWFENFVHALLEDGTYEDGDTRDLNQVMDAARKAAGMREDTK